MPTFAVDGGFWYSIPQHLDDVATPGRIVRVPLSGRRVRGWIVERADDRKGRLKDLAAISGEMPVFDDDLLQTLDWAAIHYVAPISVLLGKAGPPNLPKRRPSALVSEQRDGAGAHPLSEAVHSAVGGRRRPAQTLLGRWQILDWIREFAPLISGEKSAVVIAASAAEVDQIGAAAREIYGGSVVEVSGESDAETTRSWELAQEPGKLVLGTPRVATWPIAGLALCVVLEEGRRAMKERQTPTLHVREVIRRRSLMEGFGVVFFGPTPSVEVLATGAEVTRIGNRAWPLVEVVDRSEEPPGSGLVSEQVIAALRAVSTRGEECFVFTHRKMVEPTVAELNARLGSPSAAEHPHERPITVGTERDLAGIGGLGLTVAANVDGMLLGSGYRTSEEALRQLARLASSLRTGPGHRMMAQVMDPTLPIVETLRRGDPIPYLERVLVERGRAGAPPSTEMLAIEIRDHVPADADTAIRELPEADVLGPLKLDNGQRWLLEGKLAKARVALRSLVARWRDGGATVRIDADPIDI